MNSRIRSRIHSVAEKLASINTAGSNVELLVRKLRQHSADIQKNLDRIEAADSDGVDIQSQGLMRRALKSLSDANDALYQYSGMNLSRRASK